MTMRTHPVLDPVRPAPQHVVLEVQDQEARVQVLDEPADLQRHAEVAQRDGVARQAGLHIISSPPSMQPPLARGWRHGGQKSPTYELVDQRYHGEEVLLDGEVERIAV